jgi:uncharacterized protein (DUF1778 family)
MSGRCLAVPLLVLAGMLPRTAAHAAAADTLDLAKQVNAQIVHRHMREDFDAFARTFSGSTMMPDTLPAGCQAQMRQAVSGMYAAMVRHMQAGIDDPVFQRDLDTRLAAAYSRDELQDFLGRSATTSLESLSADVLSAPGLKDAQEAQQQKIIDSMDEHSTANPDLAAAMQAVGAADTACEQLQMDAAE